MTAVYNIAIICGTAAVIVGLVGAIFTVSRCQCQVCRRERKKGRSPRSLP